MDEDMTAQDEIDRLRGERDEWRRRAAVAEAVAAERLARAEAAERALAASEAAPTGRVEHPVTVTDTPAAPRPKSLLERWRRYTDTIN